MSLKHTLIYGNKTWSDVIFQRELDTLAARHAGKLQIVHALTREPDATSYGPNVRAGRVDLRLMNQAVSDWSNVEVFACGPAVTKYDRLAAKAQGQEATPRFLESTLAALAELGVPKGRIHSESYG
jgi:ferredoxin-NADP reductase